MLLGMTLAVMGCQRPGALSPTVQSLKDIRWEEHYKGLAFSDSAHALPAGLRPDQIRLQGEVISVTQDQLETCGPDFLAQFESGKPVKHDVIERFLADTRTHLVYRPRMTIVNGDSGRFKLMRESGLYGGLLLDFIPQRQANGSVRLYSFIQIFSTKSPLTMDCVSSVREVRPEAGSYLCYKGLRRDDRLVFVFIELLTDDALQEAKEKQGVSIPQ